MLRRCWKQSKKIIDSNNINIDIEESEIKVMNIVK